jgi:hypothetical protein
MCICICFKWDALWHWHWGKHIISPSPTRHHRISNQHCALTYSAIRCCKFTRNTYFHLRVAFTGLWYSLSALADHLPTGLVSATLPSFLSSNSVPALTPHRRRPKTSRLSKWIWKRRQADNGHALCISFDLPQCISQLRRYKITIAELWQ